MRRNDIPEKQGEKEKEKSAAETAEEAASLDAKSRAKAMLKAEKSDIDEIMAETGLKRMVVLGLKGALAKKGELASQKKEEEKSRGGICGSLQNNIEG